MHIADWMHKENFLFTYLERMKYIIIEVTATDFGENYNFVKSPSSTFLERNWTFYLM